MMHCSACGVDFTGEITACPLCGTELTGTPVPSPFPFVERQRANAMANRTLGWATLITLVVVMIMELIFGADWVNMLMAAIAIMLNYIFLRNLLVHKPTFLRTVQRYYLVLVAMAFVVFIATQSSMFSTFIIPGLCIVGMVFDAVLLTAARSRFVQKYAKYIIYFIVLGCVPLFLLLTPTVTWPWLIYASAALAVLMLVGLLIFARMPMKEEAKRLFNA